jgi:hypothetical protein
VNITEITATTLPEKPDATGDVLANAGGLGRSLLPLLLAMLLAYGVYKKTRKTKTEDITAT